MEIVEVPCPQRLTTWHRELFAILRLIGEIRGRITARNIWENRDQDEVNLELMEIAGDSLSVDTLYLSGLRARTVVWLGLCYTSCPVSLLIRPIPWLTWPLVPVHNRVSSLAIHKCWLLSPE